MKSGGASYQSGEGVPPQASDYFNMGGRKMKAGKRVLSFLLAAALAGSVAGCAPGADTASAGGTESTGTPSSSASEGEQPSGSGEKTKLVFALNDNQVIEPAEAAIAQFEEENNCEVEILTGFNGWPDYWSKMLTSIAGGNAPDVANLKETYLAELYYKDAALDITQYIEADDNVNPEDFVDAAWNAVTFDDKVYALPKHGSIVCLYYNVDLLEEAGYDRPPETWDELREYAKNMTDESKGQYGFMWYELGTREPCFAWWLGYYWMAGGKVWKNDIPGEDFNINNEAGLKALNLQLDMLYTDKSAVPPTVTTTSLAENGKVAMWMQGCWNISTYPETAPDLNWAVAPIPGDQNDAHNALVDVYAVLKDTKNPELAYQFAAMLTNEENDKNFNIASGQMPVRKANYDKEPFISDESWQTFIEAFSLPETQPKPLCEGYEELGVAMATELQKAWYGQVSAEEALASADKKAAELLQK